MILAKHSNKFPEAERLKSRKQIQVLFKSGKSFYIDNFRVTCLVEKGEGMKQTAFAVGKRFFKRAVDRNHIKRLMRESYRLQKSELTAAVAEKNLYCLISFTGKELPEYAAVYASFTKIIQRIKKRLEQPE